MGIKNQVCKEKSDTEINQIEQEKSIMRKEKEKMIRVYTKQYIGKQIIDCGEGYNPAELDVYKFAVKFETGELGFAYKRVNRFSENKHQELIDSPWIFEQPHIDSDPFGNNYLNEKESPQSDMLITVFELKKLFERYKALEYIDDYYPLTQTLKEKDDFIECGKILEELGMLKYLF